MSDQPFIYDTLRMLFAAEQPAPGRTQHPILGIERDADGALTHVDPLPRTRTGSESMMHFELPHIASAARRQELETTVVERLTRAQAMVADFDAMRARAAWLSGNLAEHLPEGAEVDYKRITSVQRFMHWLISDHFVFMAYSEYDAAGNGDGTMRAVEASRLGLARLETGGEQPPGEALRRWMVESRDLVFLGKGEDESGIHRPGKSDHVAVRLAGPERIAVFAGLFTRKAIKEEVATIPILREKLEVVLKAHSALPGSQLERSLAGAFQAIPVEFLFGASQGAIQSAITLIMEAEASAEPSIALLVGPSNRTAFVIVSLARERYDDELRADAAAGLMEAMGAGYMDWRLTFGQSGNVVLQFYLTAVHAFTHADEDEVKEALAGILGSWDSQLEAVLRSRLGTGVDVDAVVEMYRGAFSEGYRALVDPAEAAGDVEAIETVRATGDLVVTRAYRADDLAAGVTRLKLYQRDKIYLTDSTPILDRFGLRVIDQYSTTVQPADGESYYVDTFRAIPGDKRADIGDHGDTLVEALQVCFAGRAFNDSLNGLVLTAGLKRREIDVLRLYIAYSRQLGESMPSTGQRAIWRKHPVAARLLLKLFRARFHPELEASDDPDRVRLVGRNRKGFLGYLEGVEDAVEDQILRRAFNLLEATLRTNWWAGADLEDHPLAVKIDCSKVDQMPDPRPYREIYLLHTGVEGVHLRGGPVARGGLRWSTRPADFRTEVLGLMDTQMVKNVLIVPVGAKGGFVLRRSYQDRAAIRQAVDIHYEIFIRGLLDLTDNVVDGGVVPPPRVVRYDGDDPYLVVAADKGTAHLSDTANGLARDYGFWLDDAFASGGSQGYDHKKYAITAMGAWVCVRRHFREAGLDPEVDEITVVGIGDMAGDVFGNGMLLSKSMKLQAAFNHMHIFLDPDPDPATSWTERKRLFDLPSSSWEDYSADLISEGGGLYARNAKAIQLSRRVRAMLGIEEDELSGEALIRALLKMEADLLWSGGIGTYIKASHQTHRQAADPSNDNVRVDAFDLKFRVVGEGGNLGFTQAARVEFARGGGRLNTDAVDNSGGVDMSDHEVNLKILAQDLMATGELDREQRDQLLVEIAMDVSVAVCADNHDQSLGLSLDVHRSASNLDDFRVLLNDLVADRGIDRRRHVLPTDGSLLRRAEGGKGLLRPELSRIGSFVKMGIYEHLTANPEWFVPYLEHWLLGYFPSAVRERFRPAVLRHQLRVEIAATVVTNKIVNFLGMTYVSRIQRLSGRDVGDVVLATLIATELLEAWTLFDELRDVDGVRVSVEYVKLRHTSANVGSFTLWLLHRNVEVTDPASVVDRFKAGLEAFQGALLKVISGGERREYHRRIRYMRNRQILNDRNERAAALEWVAAAGDAVLLAERYDWMDVELGALLLTTVAETGGFMRIREMVAAESSLDGWTSRAIAEIRTNVSRKLLEVVQVAFNDFVPDVRGREGPRKTARLARSSIKHWRTFLQSQASIVDRLAALSSRMQKSGASGLAPAMVLYAVARQLAETDP
jgi:glutamate dehydrogenase